MTPRERAIELIDGWKNGTRWTQEISLDIERMIVAAIEQERAFFIALCEKVIKANNQVKGDKAGINLLMADLINKICARNEK